MQNAAPPLRMDQAMVVFYYDLALHMLQGMGNQLAILKRDAEVQNFNRLMEHVAEMRNSFVKETQKIVQAVSSLSPH